MPEQRPFQLRLGAISPPIDKQLAEQGLRFDPPPPAGNNHWQKNADAITDLYIRELLTEAEATKARQRLLKGIAKHIVPIT